MMTLFFLLVFGKTPVEAGVPLWVFGTFTFLEGLAFVYLMVQGVLK